MVASAIESSSVTESLYENFVAFNGEHTEVERIAIESFESLLIDKSWRPENLHLGGYVFPMQMGVLAKNLEGTSSARALLSRVVDHYTTSQKIDADQLSELHFSALLVRCGASVQIIPATARKRTPDIVCEIAGQLTDVEVVRAKTRIAHEQHLNAMSTLMGAIYAPVNASFAIFVATPLIETVLSELVDAISLMQPGQIRESVGNWHVVAGDLESGDEFVGASFPLMAPTWWQNDGPSFTSVSRMLGGPLSPAIQMKTPVPITSYLNPIKRKAERPQRASDRAFVVALDSTEMPGAADRIDGELSGYFRQWDHLSGVLVQYPFFPLLGRPKWRCRYIANPFAKIRSNLDGLMSAESVPAL